MLLLLQMGMAHMDPPNDVGGASHPLGFLPVLIFSENTPLQFFFSSTDSISVRASIPLWHFLCVPEPVLTEFPAIGSSLSGGAYYQPLILFFHLHLQDSIPAVPENPLHGVADNLSFHQPDGLYRLGLDVKD